MRYPEMTSGSCSILAKGKVEIGATRAFVNYQGHRVVLSKNLFGNPTQNHWVLTGYRDKEKGNR